MYTYIRSVVEDNQLSAITRKSQLRPKPAARPTAVRYDKTSLDIVRTKN